MRKTMKKTIRKTKKKPVLKQAEIPPPPHWFVTVMYIGQAETRIGPGRFVTPWLAARWCAEKFQLTPGAEICLATGVQISVPNSLILKVRCSA